ncbi:hypothetical protein [Ruegeria atlantica]|uniref:Uncharacterized protein n=1 Tax=Ruegeria atlantica TaxID=81569 RepID=A0ABX1WHS5_9RHOB|nr:hypothetical protein [Ruegeria atlantica]NOD32833.1 hypothetical protein [Ruegeria atlantica]
MDTVPAYGDAVDTMAKDFAAVGLSGFDRYAHDPASRTRGVNNKVQARTVAMPTLAKILY